MSKDQNFIAGRELSTVRNQNPDLGALLRRMITAIQTTARNTGVSAVGEIDPPPRIGAVNIKAASGTVHATISDNSQINSQIEYFVEHDTDPNFPAPHVVHLKASRGTFLNLPAKDDNGNPQNWYFRAYSQYPGSKPSVPVYWGGASPTAVSVGGTTQLTPQHSTGSGTASTQGGQGAWGRGKVPQR